MRRLAFGSIAVALLFISVSTSFAAGPAHFWSQRFGGTSTDLGRDVTVDAAGNVYLAGSFANTITCGGPNLTSGGLSDVCVAKFDPDGNHVWSIRVGGLMNDEAMDVEVDASGNVVVLGYFKDVIYPGIVPLGSAGAEDVLLFKLDSSGSMLWYKGFGGTGVDIGRGMAVDSNNHIVITGEFEGTVNFGGGNRASAGDSDIFLAHYDSNGDHVWSTRFGSTGADVGYDVAADPFDRATATGTFVGTVNFGGGNLISAGSGDIFLVQYSALGGYVWSDRYGGASTDQGYGVACDADGNVFMTGYFYSTANFGGSNLVTNGLSDVVIAKYSQAGVHLWSENFGGATYDKPYGIATDADGRVAVTGFYEGAADFGGGALAGHGDIDLFVAAYDADGAHRWSAGFGDTHQDDGYAVACDAAGNVMVTGFFRQTVDFGGGPLTSAGTADIPLLKFGAEPATGVGGTPKSCVLSVSNYPNPFNPGTTVSYTVPASGAVTVAVYDARGARIATLVSNRDHAAGAYTIEWDGRTNAGARVSSGVYFVRIDQNGSTRSKKITLLK